MRYNGNKFSVYESEEKTVLGLLDELGSHVNHNTDELKNKTDLYGDHKGTWQGLEKPTLSQEGAFAQVEKNTDDIKEISSQLETKTNELENKIRTISNNQIPNEYLEQQIDLYISTNNSNLATKTAINNDISVLGDKLFLDTKYFINYGQSNPNSNTMSKDWAITPTGCESKVGHNLYKVMAPKETIIKVVGADMYHIQTASNVPSNDEDNVNLIEKGSCLPISYHMLEPRQWLIVSGEDCQLYETHCLNDLLIDIIDITNKFMKGEDYELNNFAECGIKDEDGTLYLRTVVDRYSSEFIPLSIPYTIQNNTSVAIILYKYDKDGTFIGTQRVEKSQTFSSLDIDDCDYIRILIYGIKDGSVLLKPIDDYIENYDTNTNLRQTLYNTLVNHDNETVLSNNLKVHNRKAYDLKVMCINTQMWASNVELYKNILSNNNCDIVGVQEHAKSFSNGDNVVNFLKELNYCSHHELLPNETYPVGKLLSSKCDLKRYSHNHFNTQLGEIRGYQKGYIKVNGKEICVINAHLATSSAESAKIAQSMELLEVCKKEKYFILLADFNYVTTESQNEYELIAKPFINQGFNLGNWKDKNYIMTWSDSTNESGIWHPTDNIITSSNIDIVYAFTDKTKLNDNIVEPIDHLPFIAYLKVN